MTVEQRPVVAGQQAGKQPEQEKPWEPKTFAERVTFIQKVVKTYLDGKMSWEDKWYYTQRYSPGAPGEKTI